MSERWIAAADVPAPRRTDEFVLEPLGAEHNDRDHQAWMTSIDHIRSTPGFAGGDWGNDDWPYEMPSEDNLADLVRHRREYDAGEAFAYSVLDPSATDVIGCVYVNPDRTGAAEAVVRSWVVETHADLDVRLAEGVREWLDSDWPITSVRMPGRDPAG